MPMGLTNAPATFQAVVNRALHEYLDVFCTVYLDDVLVYSGGSLEEHVQHVRKVLDKMREYRLLLHPNKCEFHTTKTEYPWYVEQMSNGDTYQDFSENITITPPSNNTPVTSFGVSNDTFLLTVVVLDEVFPSLITISDPSAEPYLKVRTSFTDQIRFREVHFNPWLAPNNVTYHMERIARAMTNVVRSDADSNELIIGSASSPETYVRVEWGWLAFPLVMLLLSIVFLVATIIKTSQQTYDGIGTWKTSAMPALIYSLPKDLQQGLTTSVTPRSISKRGSKKVKVRLMPKQGWRVSGQVQPTSTAPPGFI